MPKNVINEKLEEFVRDGMGYGDPEARLQDERMFQLLMHRQIEKHEKMNTVISFVNLIFALTNIILLVYQIFLHK
ncbi:MAG: hypothetical protein WC860_08085 [Candidatus Margulisiibacteriota bacterium]|jgi:hypothetical protein